MSRNKRIDYNVLNTTGQISTKEDINITSQSENPSTTASLSSNKMSTSHLEVDISVIIADIEDIVDENPVSECSENESSATVTRLEEHRTNLRKKAMEMRSSEDSRSEDMQMKINDALSTVKDYIKTSKDFRSKSRLREEKMKADEASFKERSTMFMIEYTQRWIEDLEKEFSRKVLNEEAEKLIKWRSDLSKQSVKLEKIIETYKEILEAPINRCKNAYRSQRNW